jgi:hypothetical protein
LGLILAEQSLKDAADSGDAAVEPEEQNGGNTNKRPADGRCDWCEFSHFPSLVQIYIESSRRACGNQ